MYLDVISYLLTVLTFSVGFLSTRRHSHFDVLSKDLADRSWKIRQALNQGQDYGPRDLAEDVAAVSVEPDAVTTFARVVNASFLVAACVVVVLGLLDDGAGRSSTLLVILFISTVLVFALGEFDVWWMASRERALADGTVLGQLAVVDRALRSGSVGAAHEEIAKIREAFPHWTFGGELALALTAIDAGTGDGGVEPMELLEQGSVLYAAPVLAAEAQLSRGDPIGALQDFQVVLPRTSPSRTHDRLEPVLAFAAGLPHAVFTDPALPPGWLDDAGGLEIGLGTLPAVRRAAESLRDFGSDISLQQWTQSQPRSPAWLVASAALATDAELTRLLDLARQPGFSGVLNSLGIVYLSRGRDADALRIFEAAIRLRPNSSTSHWGRAVACARREWHDAAVTSLRRAESLDPFSTRIILVTRAALEDELHENGSIGRTGDGQWTALETIQAALLGRRVEGKTPTYGARRELVDLIVAAALETTAGVRA